MSEARENLSPAAAESRGKLLHKLRELFQLDRGDLDFGLYRVMKFKSDDVEQFLKEDLLPQVEVALGEIANADAAALQAERAKKLDALVKLEIAQPEKEKVIKDLDAQIAAAKADTRAESEVYDHLCTFFSRYYSEGDFMSLRRYKSAGKEAFAIPYNGEEVKLHWANADQFYIKTAENFASYIFTLSGGSKPHRVRFEIAGADTEKDNIKASKETDRQFILAKDFLGEDGGDLIVQFEHRPLTDGEKKIYPGRNLQKKINADMEKRIAAKLNGGWLQALAAKAPTETDADRTVLGKHLAAYTAKNSFDYFIHKDLGGFLRRELDGYLKGEVLSLESLELGGDAAFMRALAQAKAVKRVGEKIIDFLAQLEDFQKKLWLKKKFVLETNYCITLDKVPAELYSAIAKNIPQRKEWENLFAVSELPGDPASVDFLKENPYLVLDTRHFDSAFTDKLLAGLTENGGSIDAQLDGLLVHGENFQALNLLQAKYSGAVKCVYIDPPYNTAASAIIYKNDYRHSAWISLMESRIELAKNLLSADGVHCCAIDDEETWRLHALMQNLFAHELGIAVVRSNPVSRKSTGKLSPSHEYALFFGKSVKSNPGFLAKTEKQLKRYPFEDSDGQYAWLNFIRSGSNDKRADAPKMFYPIYIGKDDSIRIPQMTWNEQNREYIIEEKPRPDETQMWPVRTQNETVVEKNWQRGWERVKKDMSEYRVRRGKNGDINIDFKVRLDKSAPPSTWWADKEYASSNYGPKELKNLFGENSFDFSKAPKLVEDCLRVGGAMDGDCRYILDFFAGSGTTAHAVINLNRADAGNRKYILVELGHHFETALLPRIKKIIHAREWKDGKPRNRDGISQFIKYIRLESYEDTLDSLRPKSRNDLFAHDRMREMREDYQLRYAITEETAHCPALLGKDFVNPFAYTLQVVRDGIRRDQQVDLVETFNFLLGLRVATRRKLGGILTITGTTGGGDKCLVIWRDLCKMDATELDKWFAKYRGEFGGDFGGDFGGNLRYIYVNGEQNLNALRGKSDRWSVKITELVFRQLMFEEHSDV